MLMEYKRYMRTTGCTELWHSKGGGGEYGQTKESIPSSRDHESINGGTRSSVKTAAVRTVE